MRLELDAIVLTDHDGMCGAVRFATAARELGIRAGYGAELSLGLSAPQAGAPDPAGTHLLVLARDIEGYRRLCWVISHTQLAGEEKGRPVYDFGEVADELAGHVQELTGCARAPSARPSSSAGRPRPPTSSPSAHALLSDTGVIGLARPDRPYRRVSDSAAQRPPCAAEPYSPVGPAQKSRVIVKRPAAGGRERCMPI